MPESVSVSVRCPACRGAHRYTAPSYPCVCGAPVALPLDGNAAPTPVVHRVWQDDWVTLRCGHCGRPGEWPRPELGCPCGTLLRIPLTDPDATPAPGPRETGAAARPALPPVPIHSARDAVTATVLYLRKLGHGDIRRADQRPPSGIGLAGRGIVALLDPSAHRATPRDVECLWLTAMAESARCLYFSLAGYAPDARESADRLGVPLFLLDLTGTPQPVNAPADALDATRT
ncbi:hypothetical protein [Streptomyces cathayae]|uniref:Restriction endonuclease type IV Mrr domain-containing protein n=1 Tax=Streptomyces cathayae TaxID=3031124 RepID=A0ABY8JZ39_9ACTN|nr:hypothetical protein [Streptomyces sp. HUAS 5]WGD39941.1 hypothetical protein PYS65_07205 [Streptomyces sp. HUAS 5]